MWGSKEKREESSVIEIPKITREVFDGIKKELSKEDFEHRQRLVLLCTSHSIIYKFQLQCIELGFRWFIPSQKILQFRYHASVIWPENLHAPVRLSDSRVVYTGDIPDFALDKIEKLRPFIAAVTIHSMSPMPVEYSKIDPILVGWQDTPGMVKYSYSNNWEIITGRLGVVIAMWDMDKEIEIM